MWFLGRDRGVELIGKIRALQGFAADRNSPNVTKETLNQLYGILSILDTKATGLLTVNAFLIAAILAVLASPQQLANIIGVTPPSWVLQAQLAAFILSAFLCLLVIRVSWRFFHYVPNTPLAEADFNVELKHLANVIDDRTRYYWFGWLLALTGFVMTFAWWWWWAPLVGLLVLVAWATRGQSH
jgi:hypothetical protein